MSHFQWCHLFNKTTKFLTFPTDTPFSPGLPGSPGTPALPFSPLRPTGPVGPISPFCPLSPTMPKGPWSPFGPGTPGGPGSPVSPGKPCKWGRIHDMRRKPGFHKIALIAWNRALSRRSWSLILQCQRLDRLCEMNDGVIVTVIVIMEWSWALWYSTTDFERSVRWYGNRRGRLRNDCNRQNWTLPSNRGNYHILKPLCNKTYNCRASLLVNL